MAVGLVNLAVPECFTRRHQFVARDQQRDPHAWMYMDPGRAGGGRQGYMLRPQVRTGGEHRFVAGEILGGRPDVHARLGHFFDVDAVAVDAAVLLDDHCIGTFRGRQ